MFKDALLAYKNSAHWENLSEASKIAYRKPLERLAELAEPMQNGVASKQSPLALKQLPVAVALSRSRDDWNRDIRGLEISNNEKNKMFCVLNRVFAGAGLPPMEFKQLAHEVHETEPYNSQEIETLWAQPLSIKDRTAVAFLRWSFWSGMRPWCETSPMAWSQVRGEVVDVVGAKGREDGAVARCLRVLPQMRECLDFMQQMTPAKANQGLVWVGENGKVLTKGTIANRLQEVCKSAGVAYRQMYDARRGLITGMLRSGYSLEQAANQAGHKSIDTTRRYDQRSMEEKALSFKGL